MRKNVAGKTAKAMDAAPAAVVKAATASKAKKTAGVSRVTKSAAKTVPPRISLATLAAMDTTSSKAAKVNKVAEPEKSVRVAKVAKVAPVPAVAEIAKASAASKAIKTAKAPKLEKSPKATKTAETIKAPAVAEIADTATDSSAANGKRTLRGIKLAWNLDAVATGASKALSAPVAPPPAVEPIKVATPQPALKIRPVVRPSAPQRTPRPAFLAGVWAFLRNPPGVTMVGLAALTVALGFFAVTQEGNTSSNLAPTAMASSDDVHSPDGPGAYPPAVFPADPGPGYGGHYNYREGHVRY